MKKSSTFEVEKILGRKKKMGVDFYKIKWKGYGIKSATWEPYTHLSQGCDRLIREFEKEERLKGRERGKHDDRSSSSSDEESVGRSRDLRSGSGRLGRKGLIKRRKDLIYREGMKDFVQEIEERRAPSSSFEKEETEFRGKRVYIRNKDGKFAAKRSRRSKHNDQQERENKKKKSEKRKLLKRKDAQDEIDSPISSKKYLNMKPKQNQMIQYKESSKNKNGSQKNENKMTLKIQNDITKYLLSMPGFKDLDQKTRKKLIYIKYNQILKQKAKSQNRRKLREKAEESEKIRLFSRKSKKRSLKRKKPKKIWKDPQVKVEVGENGFCSDKKSPADDEIMIISDRAGIKNFNRRMRTIQREKKKEEQRKKKAQKYFNKRVEESLSGKRKGEVSCQKRNTLSENQQSMLQKIRKQMSQKKVDDVSPFINSSNFPNQGEFIFAPGNTQASHPLPQKASHKLFEADTNRQIKERQIKINPEFLENKKDPRKRKNEFEIESRNNKKFIEKNQKNLYHVNEPFKNRLSPQFLTEYSHLEIPHSQKKKNLYKAEEHIAIQTKPIIKKLRVQNADQIIVMDASSELDRKLREEETQNEKQKLFDHFEEREKTSKDCWNFQNLSNPGNSSNLVEHHDTQKENLKNKNLNHAISKSEAQSPENLEAVKKFILRSIIKKKFDNAAILELIVTNLGKILKDNANVAERKKILEMMVKLGTESKESQKGLEKEEESVVRIDEENKEEEDFKIKIEAGVDLTKKNSEVNIKNSRLEKQILGREREENLLRMEISSTNKEKQNEVIKNIQNHQNQLEISSNLEKPSGIRNSGVTNTQSENETQSNKKNLFKDSEEKSKEKLQPTPNLEIEPDKQNSPHFPNFEKSIQKSEIEIEIANPEKSKSKNPKIPKKPERTFETRLKEANEKRKNFKDREDSETEKLLEKFDDEKEYILGKTRRQFERQKLREKRKLMEDLEYERKEREAFEKEEKTRLEREKAEQERVEKIRKKLSLLDNQMTLSQVEVNGAEGKTLEDHDFFVDYEKVRIAQRRVGLMRQIGETALANDESLEVTRDKENQNTLHNLNSAEINPNNEILLDVNRISERRVAEKKDSQFFETNKESKTKNKKIVESTEKLQNPGLKPKHYGTIEEVTLAQIMKYGHQYLESSKYSSQSKTQPNNSLWNETPKNPQNTEFSSEKPNYFVRKDKNSESLHKIGNKVGEKFNRNPEEELTLANLAKKLGYDKKLDHSQSAKVSRQKMIPEKKQFSTEEKSGMIKKMLGLKNCLISEKDKRRNIFLVDRNAIEKLDQEKKGESQKNNLSEVREGAESDWKLENSLTKFRKSQMSGFDKSGMAVESHDGVSESDLTYSFKEKEGSRRGIEESSDKKKGDLEKNSSEKIQRILTRENKSNENQELSVDSQVSENLKKDSSSKKFGIGVDSQNNVNQEKLTFHTPKQPQSKKKIIQRKKIINSTQSNPKSSQIPKIEILETQTPMLRKRNFKNFDEIPNPMENMKNSAKPTKDLKKPKKVVSQAKDGATDSKISKDTENPKKPIQIKKVKTRDVGTDSFDLDSHRYKHYIIRNTDEIRILKKIDIKGDVYIKIRHESRKVCGESEISVLYVEPFVLKKVRPDLLCDFYERCLEINGGIK